MVTKGAKQLIVALITDSSTSRDLRKAAISAAADLGLNDGETLDVLVSRIGDTVDEGIAVVWLQAVEDVVSLVPVDKGKAVEAFVDRMLWCEQRLTDNSSMEIGNAFDKVPPPLPNPQIPILLVACPCCFLNYCGPAAGPAKPENHQLLPVGCQWGCLTTMGPESHKTIFKKQFSLQSLQPPCWRGGQDMLCRCCRVRVLLCADGVFAVFIFVVDDRRDRDRTDGAAVCSPEADAHGK